MEISLAGHSAIITGGSKGLGLATATLFAASGADVAIVARGREALDAAVKAIKASAKGRVLAVQADVAVAKDVARAFDEIMQAHGKVDIVINNAGVTRRSAFEALTDDVLQEDLDQKLFAAVRLGRLAWPQMKERRWGRITGRQRADLDLACRRSCAHQGAGKRRRTAQHPGQCAAGRAHR
jgi:3-oxoacyl-[acyl-carrier protein] reductase